MKKILISLSVFASLLISVNAFAMRKPFETVKMDAGNWASKTAPFGVEIDEDGNLSLRQGCGAGAGYDPVYLEDDRESFKVAIHSSVGGLSPHYRRTQPSLLAAKITSNGNLRVTLFSTVYNDEKNKWESETRSLYLIKDLDRDYPMCSMHSL